MSIVLTVGVALAYCGQVTRYDLCERVVPDVAPPPFNKCSVIVCLYLVFWSLFFSLFSAQYFPAVCLCFFFSDSVIFSFAVPFSYLFVVESLRPELAFFCETLPTGKLSLLYN